MANNTIDYYSIEAFKQSIMKLSSGLIWKNQRKATQSESSDIGDRYRSEIFMLANRGRLSFSIVQAFPRNVLRNVFTDDLLITRYASDKNLIPEDMRDAVVTAYQNALTSKNPETGNYEFQYQTVTIHEDEEVTTLHWGVAYDESNNYYRNLMGFPNVGEEPIQITVNGTTKPVTQLTLLERNTLEANGTFNSLIADNPTKEYLKHLGSRRIDFYKSRAAEKFALLWRNDSGSTYLNDSWDVAYSACRDMITTVYYTKAFAQTNALYDNFVAMSILFATIQRIQVKYLGADATRDFYDASSLKAVYDSYGVPYYDEIPVEYHRKIVKNINRLISNKGSDNVFFDLFEIFDLTTAELYNYFLVKTHSIDEEGYPVFNYIYDPDDVGGILGSDDEGWAFNMLTDAQAESQVAIDVEEGTVLFDANGDIMIEPNTYDLSFAKVKVGDDPARAITDPDNRLAYADVIARDPYWIEDESLREALNNTKVNYVESKYMAVSVVFDLMKITYESAFIFKMVMDNQEVLSAMSIEFAGLTGISIFDLFLYLSNLYCLIAGVSASFSDRITIPNIMTTLGYNFGELESVIKNKISKSATLSKDSTLTDMLNKIQILEQADLNNSYELINELEEYIVEAMKIASTNAEFGAYRDLYDALLTSKDILSVYTNKNEEIDSHTFRMYIGTGGSDPSSGDFAIDVSNDNAPDSAIIETTGHSLNDGRQTTDEGLLFRSYSEMLQYYSPTLKGRYDTFSIMDPSDPNDRKEIVAEIQAALDKITLLINSSRYLSTSFGIDESSVIVYLFKILSFFKSAKAELIDYNISYILQQSGMNFIRYADRFYEYTKDSKNKWAWREVLTQNA